MAGSLFPAFVQIAYTSPVGPHLMTVPVNEIQNPTAAPAAFEVDDWLSGVASLATMVDDLLEAIAVGFPTGTTFQNWAAFTLATPTSTPVFRGAAATAVAATPAGTGWFKAVQGTMTVRAEDGSTFKITLMDVGSGDDFDKIVTPDTYITSILDVVTDTGNGFRSRLGARPDTFLQYAITLNEKLRRAYRMN